MAGYTCRSCTFNGTLLQVVEHNRKVHVSDRKQHTPCCICGNHIASYKLRLHTRRRHPSDCTVRCSACNGPFVATIDMNTHVAMNHCKGMHSGNAVHSIMHLFNTSLSFAPTPTTIPADFNTFLNDCRPDDVHKYISQQLQTDETYRKECSDVVDLLDTFFEGKKGFTLKRFIKGGSLGKGTAVTSKSDIDCVMFTSDLPSIGSPHYENGLKTLLEWVEDQLKRSSFAHSGSLEISGRTSYAVKLRVKTRMTGHASRDVDLLLASDLLGEYTTLDEVYTMMGKLSSSSRQYCSAALVELQRDFVKKQRAEVKDLIRLVKMWKASCVTETSLTSYPLELLCIHVWTPYSNVAAAFRTVLQKLSNYSSISSYWTDNYDYIRALPMLRGKRPLILDPANPYNNVADRCRDWPAVARAAQETLQKPFFSRF